VPSIREFKLLLIWWSHLTLQRRSWSPKSISLRSVATEDSGHALCIRIFNVAVISISICFRSSTWAVIITGHLDWAHMNCFKRYHHGCLANLWRWHEMF